MKHVSRLQSAEWRRGAIVATAVLLAGCASFARPTSSSPKAAVRTPRGEPDMAMFERKRDDAQFAAARDRAEQGDVEAAEQQLLSLLERNSNYVEARLLLADLWVAQDRTAGAEEQLRAVLEKEPDNARAHFSLGLLYDVTDRADQAALHFRRAAELAPREEAYRLSLAAE